MFNFDYLTIYFLGQNFVCSLNFLDNELKLYFLLLNFIILFLLWLWSNFIIIRFDLIKLFDMLILTFVLLFILKLTLDNLILILARSIFNWGLFKKSWWLWLNCLSVHLLKTCWLIWISTHDILRTFIFSKLSLILIIRMILILGIH